MKHIYNFSEQILTQACRCSLCTGRRCSVQVGAGVGAGGGAVDSCVGDARIVFRSSSWISDSMV